jgi:sucrose phosphorylase
MRLMRNQVQLITYVDRLGGGGIRQLQELLAGELRGVFGAVHLLPFFDPIDGADAGFDPAEHTRVDPRLGDWGDIEALARDIDVVADLIVNHISSDSSQFQDFLRNGRASPHADMFLAFDKVFPRGATEQELLAVFRQSSTLPFTLITLPNGERRVLWTTFTARQIDIDVESEAGQAYLDEILHTFSRHGVRMIRLDAVGYAIKRAGSSCFLIPETYAFVDRLVERARRFGVEVLAEIHSHHHDQVEMAKHVDYVYDFALPPLLLHAFHFRTSRYLKRWIEIRPRNALTVLDTHDGIGMIDIASDSRDPQHHPGLVPDSELRAVIESVHEQTRGESRAASGVAAANVDENQINTTFYDALGADDLKYLLARALQFFLPGVPQVYYVGLLAGRNDMELLARTRVGRDINRHYYQRDEIRSALNAPVPATLIELIRLRNSHPAFGGEFSVLAADDGELRLRWQQQHDFAELHCRFDDLTHSLTYSRAGTVAKFALAGVAR